MPKLQLGFYGHFLPKGEDLSKILNAAGEEQGLQGSNEQLYQRTNIGGPKVSRLKSWAIRSGLVHNHYLSSEGKIVMECDRYLESPITAWLMHFYLCLGGNGLQAPPQSATEWGGWTYFIFEFLGDRNSFTLDDFFQGCEANFELTNSKTVKTLLRTLMRTYTDPASILSRCQLFSLESNNRYKINRITPPNIYLIGYFLAKLWERDFPETTSILTEKVLLQPYGLGPILNIEPDILQGCLTQLETKAIVEQRRTVPPAQIVCRWDDPLKLLEKAYQT
ncbi:MULTISPECIES: DUF4007 family protein [Spirulina sp. CCY15215]|uniref:DUF4007 family protein n=1 Tax=Spirulina sp. CCY15215 TaxID=2767591 RepID=UPI00195276B7|nr:DUF4007 family protein [Spirulina major]